MKSNFQQLTYPLAKPPKVVPNTFTIHPEEFYIIGAGALLLLLTLLAEPLHVFEPLRLLLGAVYVLFIPGYSLTTALFPKRDALEPVERVGMSLGMSIAVVPLLALLLDRSPWGLHIWPIICGELSIIALGTLVTLFRRGWLLQRNEYVVTVTTDAVGRWRVLVMGRDWYRVAAGVLLLVALTITWLFVDPLLDKSASEFYILGSEGLAEQYPQAVAMDDPLEITLGLANRERESHTYSVEVWVRDPWSERAEELVARAGPIELAAGEEFQQSLKWSMPWAGQDQEVEFLLFTSEQDAPEPYRQLRLLLDVEP